jgi:hypothetical protein
MALRGSGMEEMNVTTWEEFLGGLEEIQKERAGSSDYVQLSSTVSWSREFVLAA